MRRLAAVSLVLLSSSAGTAQELEPHTLKSNLQYRLTQGDLPKLSFGVEKPKSVEVIEGGEELLQNCLSDSVTWSRDPLLFRLAHTHARSIRSCRENRSPSLHAIFLKVPDEPLQVWVHFDGHGAQTSGSRMVHLGEFLYHKITFQNNDQNRMFENLERSLSNPLGTSSSDTPLTLTARDRLTLFTNKTMTQAQPYAASLVSSAALMLISPTDLWGRGADNYTNHLVASFSQRLVKYGIQSGAAAALHEDLRYRPSLSRNPWKRSAHALESTLVLETPRGNDIAFANIIAAVGGGVVIHATRPGQEDPGANFIHPGVLDLAGRNLLGFAEGNLWNEFKPDIQHFLRSRLLRRK